MMAALACVPSVLIVLKRNALIVRNIADLAHLLPAFSATKDIIS